MSSDSNARLEDNEFECARCGKRLEHMTALCPCYKNPLNKTKSAQLENQNIEELRK